MGGGGEQLLLGGEAVGAGALPLPPLGRLGGEQLVKPSSRFVVAGVRGGDPEAARLFDKLLATEEAEHAPSLFDPATTTSEPNRNRYGLQLLVEEEEALAVLRAGRAEVEALAARARDGDPAAVTELRRRGDTGDPEAAAAVAAGEAALQAAADLLREMLGAEEVE